LVGNVLIKLPAALLSSRTCLPLRRERLLRCNKLLPHRSHLRSLRIGSRLRLTQPPCAVLCKLLVADARGLKLCLVSRERLFVRALVSVELVA
jgi:hypothetical protein